MRRKISSTGLVITILMVIASQAIPYGSRLDNKGTSPAISIQTSKGTKLPFWEKFEEGWSKDWTTKGNARIAENGGFGGLGGQDDGACLSTHASVYSSATLFVKKFYGVFAMDFKLDSTPSVSIAAKATNGRGIWEIFLKAGTSRWNITAGVSTAVDTGYIGYWYGMKVVFNATKFELFVDGLFLFMEDSSSDAEVASITVKLLGTGQEEEVFYFDNVVAGEVCDDYEKGNYGSGTAEDPILIEDKIFVTDGWSFINESIIIRDTIFLLDYTRDAIVISENIPSLTIENVYIKNPAVALHSLRDPEITDISIVDSYIAGWTDPFWGGIALKVDSQQAGSCNFTMNGTSLVNIMDLRANSDQDPFGYNPGQMGLGQRLSLRYFDNVEMNDNHLVNVMMEIDHYDVNDLVTYIIPTSNSINNEPILYRANDIPEIGNDDYGQIILANVTGGWVENVTALNVAVLFSSDTCLKNVTSVDSTLGVYLSGTRNISISESLFDLFVGIGVEDRLGVDNKFINNTFVDCTKAIRLFLTTGDVFLDNTVNFPEDLAELYSISGGDWQGTDAFEIWGGSGLKISRNIIVGYPYPILHITLYNGYVPIPFTGFTIADNILDSKNYTFYQSIQDLTAIRIPYYDGGVIYGNVFLNYHRELFMSNIALSKGEDYYGYDDGEIPTTNHLITGNSPEASYTVEEFNSGSKAGFFNDWDNGTALQVVIDIEREIQYNDALSWSINLDDITNGKSAVWGLVNESLGGFLLIKAYESDDGLTHEFFIIDADGTIMIQDFSLNTWYSFTVVFTGDGTYDLLINWTTVVSGRSLGEAGSTLKYLGFFDADGLSNWQGYVDDITATWY